MILTRFSYEIITEKHDCANLLYQECYTSYVTRWAESWFWL